MLSASGLHVHKTIKLISICNGHALEAASTEYELAMNDTLAKYIQYRLVVEQFNGRASMAENVVTEK